jgi:predicted nucleic acid-binding protein
MPIVLDASVVAAWALPDETTQPAATILERVSGEGATAPPIWWYEVRNMLLMAERRNRILADQSDMFFRRLSGLPIRIADRGTSGDVLRLARTHNLTVYDAAYLELSLREGLALATLDRRLAGAAVFERVSVIPS